MIDEFIDYLHCQFQHKILTFTKKLYMILFQIVNPGKIVGRFDFSNSWAPLKQNWDMI